MESAKNLCLKEQRILRPYFISLPTRLSNRSLKHIIEGRIEVTGRRGKRCKQLLDYLKEKGGYWKLQEEAPDRAVWRTCCGRGCGPVVRQSRWWMKPIYPGENIFLELDPEGEGSSIYSMRILNTIFYIFIW